MYRILLKIEMLKVVLFVILLLGTVGVKSQTIVDSNISLEQALVGTLAPSNVTDCLAIVDVEYYSMDNRLHRGQIVIDSALRDDVIAIFELIKQRQIVIDMVIPIKCDLPNAETTMADLNNTYGFHYRQADGEAIGLSQHSFGRAIDFNPFDNPYVYSNGTVIPKGAFYNTQSPKALTLESAIVRKMVEMGWTWGGSWNNQKDYMHFEKPK